MLVGLVYNLKPPAAAGDSGIPSDTYAEWDDPKTIAAVRRALEKLHEVVLIDARGQARQNLIKIRPDIVFNLAEGASGAHREAEIPVLLESLDIPYTGSGPTTLSLCLDKARTNRLLNSRGIPTARFAVFAPGQTPSFDLFPAMVKPNWEGSSKGILNSSVVSDAAELSREAARIWENYRQPALVEEFLEGREFTVALLGNGPDLEVLPIVEIALDCLPPSARRIYSYEAKWVWDRPENPLPIHRCPAEISRATAARIRDLAIQAFNALGCRDWCRIDLRADAAGDIRVLEVNPLPGILPDPRDNSCFPTAARAAGISYDDLILKVLSAAGTRQALQSRVTSAPKAASA